MGLSEATNVQCSILRTEGPLENQKKNTSNAQKCHKMCKKYFQQFEKSFFRQFLIKIGLRVREVTLGGYF